MSDFTESPHRRRNALTGEWLLVSPHRALRPWQGRNEPLPPASRPPHDPACYLCAGNLRANGQRNPHYASTFAFDNDFAALLPESHPTTTEDPLFLSQPVRGVSRVICFSPRHDLSLAQMPTPEILGVINCWADETSTLGRQWTWVQVFENKGEIMGCSNPHPHGQIWASDQLPNEITKEDLSQRLHFEKYHRPLLLDYADRESQLATRTVIENPHWLVVVPYWAVWPFETLLLPKFPVARLPDLDPSQRQSLAEILQQLLHRYDQLFGVSFPYSMGWHGAPFSPSHLDHWQLHAHFYPPLLRSASIKKFMVGYEMLAEPQRDLTPEAAAATLRSLPNPPSTSPI